MPARSEMPGVGLALIAQGVEFGRAYHCRRQPREISGARRRRARIEARVRIGKGRCVKAHGLEGEKIAFGILCP